MMTIAVLFLFVALLISFYLIALLNVKVSKFDDLEMRQSKLMREMDDSIGAYLAELKDENDRLINQLKVQQEKQQNNSRKTEKDERIKNETMTNVDEIQVISIKKPSTPMNHVLKSYGATGIMKQEIEQSTAEVDDRSRSIKLYDAGYSIEEIAKKLGKGKTEIELILKFK